MLLRHYASDVDILDSDYQIAEPHLYYFYKTLEKMQKFIEKHNGYATKEMFDSEFSKEIVTRFI